jgi:Flp pilus assembly protein CpaB
VTYRLRNIVLAVVLATLAAVLTSFYVSNYKKSVQAGEENVTVFVAKTDIAAGTSGSRAAGLLEPVEVERKNVVTGAITSKEQVKELIAKSTIYRDEQVTTRRFSPVDQIGVRAELKGSVRAIQIAGDPHQVLAGTLKRGDRVDVVGNFKVKVAEQNEPQAFTRTVLRDILVLKAPSNDLANGKLTSTVTTASAQLALTDAQAQKLFFTMKNGEWHFDMRSVVDASDSSESVESISTILCDGIRRSNAICNRRAR